MTPNDRPTYHRALHFTAVLLTVATFPLIFLGGLVTTKNAGMSVPDWPNSYGYNMFLFPVNLWVGQVFYEHVHRLKGTLVGFVAINLVLQSFGTGRCAVVRKRLGIAAGLFGLIAGAWGITVWAMESAGRVSADLARNLQHGFVGFASIALVLLFAIFARRIESRRWVRRLCVAVLVAVCIQGLFGGLRVTKVNLTLAIIHGCFAQAFFAFAAIACVVTSRWWVEAPDLSSTFSGKAGRRLAAFAMVCFAAVYLQLIIGATMRHHGAGLAIPDLPFAYGKLLPPTDPAGLNSINQFRAWTLQEKPVTFWQLWLHFGHRVGAIVVSTLLIALIVVGWRAIVEPKIRRPLLTIGLLLATQFTLGLLTVYYKKPAEIASAHVAVGALLVLTVAVLTIRTMRLYSTWFRTVSAVEQSAAVAIRPPAVAAAM